MYYGAPAAHTSSSSPASHSHWRAPQYDEQGFRIKNLKKILAERRAAAGEAEHVADAWPFAAATGPVGVHAQSCAIAIDTKVRRPGRRAYVSRSACVVEPPPLPL